MTGSGRQLARLVPIGRRPQARDRRLPGGRGRRRRRVAVGGDRRQRRDPPTSAPRSSPSIHRHHRSRCRSSVATRSSCCGWIPGVEVEVEGYESEPYLRFAADGTVYENQHSPATYINGSRYGGGSIPEGASADAEPDWAEVAPAGERRVRLARPPFPPDAADRARSARERGDQVFTDVVPIVVDGARGGCPDREHVDARSVAMAGGARRGARRDRGRGGLRRADVGDVWGPVLVGVGGIAAVIGWIGYASLPSVTGPRPVWWLLPVLAVAFGDRSVGARADTGRVRGGRDRRARAGGVGVRPPRRPEQGAVAHRRAVLDRPGGDRRQRSRWGVVAASRSSPDRPPGPVSPIS